MPFEGLKLGPPSQFLFRPVGLGWAIQQHRRLGRARRAHAAAGRLTFY